MVVDAVMPTIAQIYQRLFSNQNNHVLSAPNTHTHTHTYTGTNAQTKIQHPISPFNSYHVIRTIPTILAVLDVPLSRQRVHHVVLFTGHSCITRHCFRVWDFFKFTSFRLLVAGIGLCKRKRNILGSLFADNKILTVTELLCRSFVRSINVATVTFRTPSKTPSIRFLPIQARLFSLVLLVRTMMVRRRSQ